MASSWVQHSSRSLQTELKFFCLIRRRMTKISKYECCAIAVQANRERAARNIQGMLTVASTCKRDKENGLLTRNWLATRTAHIFCMTGIKSRYFFCNTLFSSYNGSKSSSLFMLKKQQNCLRTSNRPASRTALIFPMTGIKSRYFFV